MLCLVPAVTCQRLLSSEHSQKALPRDNTALPTSVACVNYSSVGPEESLFTRHMSGLLSDLGPVPSLVMSFCK